MIERRTYFVPNDRGWELCVKRSVDRGLLARERRPVVLFPGLGMNSYLFGFHPGGASMVDTWVKRGHEVWTVDLRGQGASRRTEEEGPPWGLADLALHDTAYALDFIVSETLSRASRVIGVGCSLGGSLLYAYVGLSSSHRVGALVPMGAPLRWEDAHIFFRVLSASPRIGRIFALTPGRAVVRAAMALARVLPWTTSMYVHRELVDLDNAGKLLFTVDPLRAQLMEEMGRWVKQLDLEMRGSNVTQAFLRTTLPMLCVLGVGDGVVPEAAALSACRRRRGVSTEVLRVGGPDEPFAHADLFLGREAPNRVFLPIARWMESAGQRD